MPLDPGSRLGPYEVISPLGAGGMGEVFRARDTRLERTVAIKVLPAEFSENAQLKLRFEREAKTISHLEHPHICRLYDVGHEGGREYLVMELLEGDTLRQKLDSGAISPRKAIEYAVQIANGLAAAHDKGIVHRDLKPENIFVTSDGSVKLLDFGLAKNETPLGSGSTEAPTQARVTGRGVVMGTVGYMSPEQVRGQETDHRTDIFAFGAILYEMLSGRRAFKGASAADVMTAVLKDDPADLSSSAIQLSPALDRIVRRCLEKNRAERFHSAHDLALALEAISGSTSAPSGAALTVAPQGWRRRALFTVAIVAVAAGAYMAGRRSGAAATEPPGRSQVPRFRQLTFAAGREMQPSISRDGSSFVFVSSAGGNADIYLQRVGGEATINLTGDCDRADVHPAFSPDGQHIAFRSECEGGGIFLVGATGESRRRLSDAGYNPAWSPDGKEIVVGTEGIADPFGRFGGSELWRIELATGKKTRVFGGDAVQPAWSPDGQRIAFWGMPRGTGRRVLYTIPAAGGEPVAVIDDGSFNWSPAWSPDGTHLYYASHRGDTMNLWRVRLDPTTWKAAADPEPLTSATGSSGPLSVAADGRIAFAVTTSMHSIIRYPFDPVSGRVTGPPFDVVRGTRAVGYASPSPDSERVVFVVRRPVEDVLIANADGSKIRRLTDDRYKARTPTWSPDGKAIYFSTDRTGHYELWRINVDGTGLQQITDSKGEYSPWFTSALPDGRRRVVTWREEGATAAIIDLSGPLPTQRAELLPPFESYFTRVSSVSPDGRRLAAMLATSTSQNAGLGVFSFDTQQWERVADRGTVPAWLPDGRRLLFRTGREVQVVDTVTREVRSVLEVPWDFGWGGPALSRDGRAIYLTREENEDDIWMLSMDGAERETVAP